MLLMNFLNPLQNNGEMLLMNFAFKCFSVIDKLSDWMSEWLLVNANSICQLYHGQNNLIINAMMMVWFSLY
jgi:hypothetical protein